MGVSVTLPEDLALQIDRRVSAGEFPSRDDAVAYYVRRGMEGGGGGRDRPPRPPTPPGHREPSDDRPIQVDPTDVNWA